VCIVTSVVRGKPIIHPIPLSQFELALECSGSFLLHFSIDKTSDVGLENRELLMTILEPLLGKEMKYSIFLTGVNQYISGRRYQDRLPELKDNGKRFLDEVQMEWKQKKQRRYK
jgi:hypothetical protein